MLAKNPKKLYLIDAWENQTDYIERNGIIPHSHVASSSQQQDEWFNEVKNKFAKSDNVEIIKGYSVNVSNDFNDNYFDFIFIDALHNYESVRDDIMAWKSKVKTNGIMCFDDYVRCNDRGYGVIEAVDKFVDNDYILERVHHSRAIVRKLR